MNCLTYALEFWLENQSYVLWYNSNHVIAIEPEFDLSQCTNYLKFDAYGIEHFKSSFLMTKDYKEILEQYFAQL